MYVQDVKLRQILRNVLIKVFQDFLEFYHLKCNLMERYRSNYEQFENGRHNCKKILAQKELLWTSQ